MMFAGKSVPVTADQVTSVRFVLGETQNEFAGRFARSRFTIIRWEATGVKFKYQSNRWHRWQSAVARAIQLSITRGLPDDDIEQLRELQILSPKW